MLTTARQSKLVASFRSSESTSSQAITGNKRQSEELVAVVRQDYRWLLFVLPLLCILIGVGLSVWYEHWIGAVPR